MPGGTLGGSPKGIEPSLRPRLAAAAEFSDKTRDSLVRARPHSQVR